MLGKTTDREFCLKITLYQKYSVFFVKNNFWQWLNFLTWFYSGSNREGSWECDSEGAAKTCSRGAENGQNSTEEGGEAATNEEGKHQAEDWKDKTGTQDTAQSKTQ